MKKNRSIVVLAALSAGLLLGACSTTPTVGEGQIKTQSDQTDTQRRAQIRLQLAVGYYEQGQFEVALDEVKQALQIDPDMAESYSMRGLIYMAMNEAKLADESFREALRRAPDNPDFSNNYGWFLCQNGRAQESIPYFEAALKERSYRSPSKALHNAGVCSLKLQQLDAAKQYLTRAFQLEAGNAEISANLAYTHWKLGDANQARFYLDRVQQSDMNNAQTLWTAIKVSHGLNDRQTETTLVTQLRRAYPKSPEYAAYLRGAFNE